MIIDRVLARRRNVLVSPQIAYLGRTVPWHTLPSRNIDPYVLLQPLRYGVKVMLPPFKLS